MAQAMKPQTFSYLPILVVMGWVLWTSWSYLPETSFLSLIAVAPFGFMPWLHYAHVPDSLVFLASFGLFILLLSLPWFSILASDRRATALCTAFSCLLVLGHARGCQIVKKLPADQHSTVEQTLDYCRTASIAALNSSKLSAIDGSASNRFQRASSSCFMRSVITGSSMASCNEFGEWSFNDSECDDITKYCSAL